jgi:hypothetical protein
VRVKLGSVAYLKAAGRGYLIGLDDNGHLVEALGEWSVLEPLRELLGGDEPAYLEVEDWQVLAIDEELTLLLSREAMAERAAFLRSGLTASEP